MNIIKEMRAKRGLTQKELASKVGTSYRHIQSIEQNVRKPSTELLIKIFKELKIPISKIEFFLQEQTTK